MPSWQFLLVSLSQIEGYYSGAAEHFFSIITAPANIIVDLNKDTQSLSEDRYWFMYCSSTGIGSYGAGAQQLMRSALEAVLLKRFHDTKKVSTEPLLNSHDVFPVYY